jgi:hypothetical protein
MGPKSYPEPPASACACCQSGGWTRTSPDPRIVTVRGDVAATDDAARAEPPERPPLERDVLADVLAEVVAVLADPSVGRLAAGVPDPVVEPPDVHPATQASAARRAAACITPARCGAVGWRRLANR